jgi:Cu2+-containing amine oxidase
MNYTEYSLKRHNFQGLFSHKDYETVYVTTRNTRKLIVQCIFVCAARE